MKILRISHSRRYGSEFRRHFTLVLVVIPVPVVGKTVPPHLPGPKSHREIDVQASEKLR